MASDGQRADEERPEERGREDDAGGYAVATVCTILLSFNTCSACAK